MATHDDVKDETDAELVEWALSIENDKITKWEIKFVEDMDKVLKTDGSLSPGRRTKLEQIILERDK